LLLDSLNVIIVLFTGSRFSAHLWAVVEPPTIVAGGLVSGEKLAAVGIYVGFATAVDVARAFIPRITVSEISGTAAVAAGSRGGIGI
jgi:predicted membrane-bound dolichyl-phosphate-mannose-protein mannosyltransferase